MKVAFFVSLLICNNFLYAQNSSENDLWRTVITDNFSRMRDTTFSKKGKVKKIKFRKEIPSIAIINVTNLTSMLEKNINSYQTYNYFNKETLELLDSTTYIDLIEKNKTSVKIDTFSVSPEILNISFISSDSAYSLMKGGWGIEIVNISRAGFNKDKTQAFIYFEHSRCDMCGSGYFSFYKLINGRWRLVRNKIAWMS